MGMLQLFWPTHKAASLEAASEEVHLGLATGAGRPLLGQPPEKVPKSALVTALMVVVGGQVRVSASPGKENSGAWKHLLLGGVLECSRERSMLRPSRGAKELGNSTRLV